MHNRDATLSGPDHYEEARRRSASEDARTNPAGAPVQFGAALRWTDVPVRKKRVIILELHYDIQRIVDALKLRTKPVWVHGHRAG